MRERRKLPLLTDHSLAKIKSARTQIADDFERKVREFTAFNNQTLSCRVGCVNCCYHPIHVSVAEAVLVYRYLTENGRWTPSLQERVRKHAEQTKDLPFEVWFLSVIPCPLLDETTKKCTAYKGRPFQCRVTFAVGNPEDCHPHRVENMVVPNRQPALGEFHGVQNRELRRHKTQVVLVPLSVGLLLAEKIVTGDLDIEQSEIAVLREYLEVP